MLVGVGHDRDVTVECSVRATVGRHDSAVARTRAGDRRCGQVLDEIERQHRVEHRNLNLLTLTGAIAVYERSENPVGDHYAGELVADQCRHERGDAQDVVIQRRETGEGLDDVVIGRGISSSVPEANPWDSQ